MENNNLKQKRFQISTYRYWESRGSTYIWPAGCVLLKSGSYRDYYYYHCYFTIVIFRLHMGAMIIIRKKLKQ